MKHTKGEWIQDGQSVYSLHQIGWDKGEPLMSNRFHLRVYPDYRIVGAEEEAEANAKLIAAAPDLLDNLFEAEKILMALDDVSEQRMKLIRDAIKKATE